MNDDYFYNYFQQKFSTAQRPFPKGVGVEKSIRLANRVKLFTNTYNLRLWECPQAVLEKIIKELRNEWEQRNKI